MNAAPEEIEVEVVEIDDRAPRPRKHPEPAAPRSGRWRQWPDQIRNLPGYLWPLWIILGAIALALLLTIGVVIGIVYLIIKAIGRLLRGLSG